MNVTTGAIITLDKLIIKTEYAAVHKNLLTL